MAGRQSFFHAGRTGRERERRLGDKTVRPALELSAEGGKRLAVGDVLMYSAGESVPCARASVTYAIPSVRLDPPLE